jgi:TPR repeat protein
MNDAGLVPAGADDTWARRFGDCKGKSVLLVAILRALGLGAGPTAVSTQTGDGMDQRLPNIGWFDHVIVKLEIAGKTYWLDSTRQGDPSLDDLTIPNHHWALPIQPGGAGLAPLDPPPLSAPLFETLLMIDASKGIARSAPTHVEVIYRGDGALAARQSLMSVPRADYERSLREMLTKMYPWLTVDRVDIVRADTSNQVRLTGDGLAKVDWATAPDGIQFYHAPGTSMANDTTFKREPGPNTDAPFFIPYPNFVRSVQEVTLPVDGDFTLIGADVDAKVAGQELKRASRIEGGVLRIEMSARSFVPEFPASNADAAGAALRALPRGEVVAVYHARTGQAQLPARASNGLETDRQAAERSDAAAQYRLGQMYSRGQGVPLGETQAMTWFHKAADQGYGPAQGVLGAAYLTGSGEPRDYAQALNWLRKGAAQDDLTSETDLAYTYAGGAGFARDDAQAFVWAQKATAGKSALGELILGSLYLTGAGAPKDPVQAVAWFHKAADQGLTIAKIRLAAAYREGVGVPKQAAAWAQKAADQGAVEAEDYLAYLYRNGFGVRQDDGQAMAWYRKAAEQGDANAELRIAGCYFEGLGVPKDVAQSYDWVRKAANQGSAEAENNIGWAYEIGRDLPRDYVQARFWLDKAADQGYPWAENAIGVMYDRGEGVARDPALALLWFRKSAAKNHAKAQYNLGSMYQIGDGVARNLGQALPWFEKATVQGNGDAEFALPRMDATGEGVPKDEVKAIALLNKSVAHKYQPAIAFVTSRAGLPHRPPDYPTHTDAPRSP